MTRVLAYAVCLAGVVWLAFESVHFRQAIRTSRDDAYSRMEHVLPDRVGDAGKVLNSYYEDVYLDLPSMFWPAGMLIVGSTVLFIVPRPNKTQPGTAPNGGPTTRLGGSGVTDGPLSVS
jgi:hypothetical protein